MERRSTQVQSHTSRLGSNVGVALLSASALVIIAVLWHFIAPTTRPNDASYRYSNILMPSFGWLMLVSICIAAGLGYITSRKWPVALGLIVPFLIALVVEITRDPTSHNLFPFEILLSWVPLFLVAFVAAHAGRRLRHWND